MSLDELSLDGSEGVGASGEAPSEKSEKQKEQSRKAQAQLQKTQKDEKKAKTDNEELFQLLSRFIQNPLYEELIPSVVLLLQKGYPSRFVLTIIALVFPEASHYLLHHVGLSEKTYVIPELFHSEQKIIFDDDTLHPSLREWITLWLTATENLLTQESTSTILSQKLSLLLREDTHEAPNIISLFFQFFFASKNIEISEKKALAYSEYIVSQISRYLQEFLLHQDVDLRMEQKIEARDLFGV